MNLQQVQETPEFLSHLLVTQVVSLTSKFGASKYNKAVICMDNRSWRKEYYEKNKSQFPDMANESYKGQRTKSDTIDWEKVYSIFEE
ncbi:hypothetical protein ABK046_46660, partial [Streptomyces caeruleatus]